MYIENGGFFFVNKYFVFCQVFIVGGICNFVNVSGFQGRLVIGFFVLEVDNLVIKFLIIYKNEFENVIQCMCKSDFYFY